MSVSIILDSSIRLNPQDLPNNVLDEIFYNLEVPNPQKKIAEREMLWNADDIPEYLKLWRYNGHNELILPRGFLFDLDEIFKKKNLNVKYMDGCTLNEVDFKVSQLELREYQWKAFHELMVYGCGMYKAPTGSGKTITMLEVIRQAKQKTLVICEKSDIAQQWYRSANIFGFDVGLASGRNFDDDKDLVIAMRQSLWSKELDQRWFDQWGMVVLDEAHHSSAETMFELIQRFPAYYRYGCSATPDSDPELFPIARAVIGPVVAQTDIEEIGDHLVTPSVKVVKTEFEFDYRPTVRIGKKVIRNNYGDMMKALEENKTRNYTIMGLVLFEAKLGHNCLIYSSRKEHLRYLEDALYQILGDEIGPKVLSLTGDNSKESLDIASNINFGESGSVLFSTLANEGTNIPILDRIFLTYPGRKLRGFEQSIGRIMRPHPKKKDAIVYDFRDIKVSLLNSQYRTRAQGIYNKRGYKVETLND